MTRAGEHIKTLSDVFEPLVAQAQADGEIRTQLAPERTAEWLARMCLTFALDPADVDDDALVTLFFREHLQGLAP